MEGDEVLAITDLEGAKKIARLLEMPEEQKNL
jgi:hypothetical protein